MGDSSERKQGRDDAPYCGEMAVLKDAQSAAIEDVSNNIIFMNGEDDQEPKVGMVFESYDEVFRFYKEYGHRKGFGVVIKRSWFRKGKCRRADLSCWKGGCGSANQPSSPAKPTTKTNCPAMITVRNWKDDLLFVTDVVLEHNHLLSPSKARFFRCNRKLPLKQNGGYVGIAIDQNYVHKEGTLKLKEGDAMAICEFFLRMQRKNPNFFYLLDWDEEGHLRNLFWADAKSRASYAYFGDVVTFDATYLINKYESPLVSFVGVNHHGQSVLFGCGLLASGTSENYVWLFEAWSSCASGRSPKAIITDQCAAIQYAVSEAFPDSRHRFCLLRILKKMPENLGDLEQYKAIKRELKRIIYDSATISDFEDWWKRMIEEFRLELQKWLQELYDNRHFWAPVFLKNVFWAGMSTTQRNQSMNSYFDDYINSKTSLQQFITIYEMALQDSSEKEAEADFESLNSSRYLLTQLPMEEKISKLYTLNMFKKFQEELKAAMKCNVSVLKVDGPVSSFQVTDCGLQKDGLINPKRRSFKSFEVSYDATRGEVECMCKRFDFEGIVCRHALSVLRFCQVYNLPSKYVVDRWGKDFKRFHGLSHDSDEAVAANELERYDLLTQRSLRVVELAASSDSNFQLVMKLLDKIERSSW